MHKKHRFWSSRISKQSDVAISFLTCLCWFTIFKIYIFDISPDCRIQWCGGKFTKACQNCYYCNNSIRFAGNWWISCSNQGKSSLSKFNNKQWGKSQLNLPCWRSDAPSTNIIWNSKPTESYVSNPVIPVKRVGRIRRFYPNQKLTVSWNYVLRSKIAHLFHRNEV